jgi:hypothetical protein
VPLDVLPLDEVVDEAPPAPPMPWFVPPVLPQEAVAAPSASVSAARRKNRSWRVQRAAREGSIVRA